MHLFQKSLFRKLFLSALGCCSYFLVFAALQSSTVGSSVRDERPELIKADLNLFEPSNTDAADSEWGVPSKNWLYPIPQGLRNKDENSPAGVRTSGGTFGGNECQETKIPLTALVPGESSRNGSGFSYLARTAQNSPTLWFYVPDFGPAKLSARLQVRDPSIPYPNSDVLYEEFYELSNYLGIVRIPTRIRELEFSKDYKWDFSVICDSEDPSKDHLVSGVFRKVEFDFQVNEEAPEEKARLLYQAVIWHDAFSILMDEMYTIQPKQALDLVQQLLVIVDLKDIAENIPNEDQQLLNSKCCSYQADESQQSSQ